MDEEERPSQPGIAATDCERVELEDVAIIGFDEAVRAQSVGSLEAHKFTAIARVEPPVEAKSKQWVTWIFLTLTTVVGGLIVAYAVYRFGWNKVRS